MIKKTIVLVIFILFVLLLLSFFKTESFIKEFTDMSKEKVKGFLREKRGNIIKKINMELWENIGNSLFNRY